MITKNLSPIFLKFHKLGFEHLRAIEAQLEKIDAVGDQTTGEIPAIPTKCVLPGWLYGIDQSLHVLSQNVINANTDMAISIQLIIE